VFSVADDQISIRVAESVDQPPAQVVAQPVGSSPCRSTATALSPGRVPDLPHLNTETQL
jgi:hypothetical protein